jgi:hypothetical protein
MPLPSTARICLVETAVRADPVTAASAMVEVHRRAVNKARTPAVDIAQAGVKRPQVVLRGAQRHYGCFLLLLDVFPNFRM